MCIIFSRIILSIIFGIGIGFVLFAGKYEMLELLGYLIIGCCTIIIFIILYLKVRGEHNDKEEERKK